MNYNISDYPTVIDPVTDAIELHVAPHEGAAGVAGWRQFGRVHAQAACDLPFTPTACRAHLFGDNGTIGTSKLLMVYDNRGAVQCLLARGDDNHWVDYAIPEEFSGHDVKPSLRLPFQSKDECTQGMMAIEALIAAWRAGENLETEAETLAKLLADQPPAIYTSVLTKTKV
jgi:hypothetical protein